MTAHNRGRLWKVVGLLCGLAVLAPSFASATATSAQAGDPGKRAGGIVPHYGVASAQRPTTETRRTARAGFDLPPTPGPLMYHGGRVMHTATIRHVFWVPAGYTLPTYYRALIDTFMTDAAADSGRTSNVYASDTQYTDSTTGHIQYSLAFGGSMLITDPFPASATTDRADCPLSVKTTCVTDTELEQKLEAVATANGWPLNTFTNAYAIFTPPGVDVCIDWAGGPFDRPCSYNAFCAYHSWGDLPAPPFNPKTIYAVEPAFEPTGICNDPGNAFVSGDGTTDITINTLSHESNEFITDPTPTAAPFGGWFDANGEENADKCAYNFESRIGTTGAGAPYNQLVNGHPYMLQRSWSNAVVPGTTAPGCYSIGAPTITAITPQSLPSGSDAGITGSNFFFALGTTPTVKFNGLASPSVVVDSPTHITARVPAGNAGGKVIISGAVGGQATSTVAFHLQPVITNLNVTSGVAGDNIIVFGTGFFGVTSVKVNGVAGAFRTVAPDGTSLHLVIPTAATTGPVTVTTAGGIGQSPTNFVVLPHLTSFAPLAAPAGANVTIRGTGFSGVPVVDFAGSPGAVVISHTATVLIARVPVNAINGPLTVTTGDGSSASAPTLKPLMRITSFDVASYRGGTLVTVSGSNFLANAPLTTRRGTLGVTPASVT